MIIGGKLVKQYTIDEIIFGVINVKLVRAVPYKYNLILTYVKIQLQDSPWSNLSQGRVAGHLLCSLRWCETDKSGFTFYLDFNVSVLIWIFVLG